MSDRQNTAILGRGDPDEYVSLAAHPRAQRSIARSKALGGVIGFVIGLWLGSRAGLPAWDAGVRALAGGIAGYVLVWVAALQIWRQIVVGEYRAAEVRRAASRQYNRDLVVELARQRAEAAKAARQG